MNNLYFYLSKILAPFLNPSNILLIVFIILFATYFRNKTKFFFKLLIINLSFLVIISFLPIGNLGLNYLEKNYFDQKKYKNIKNILVLSGSEERIITSIKLSKEYPNSKIYFIGGSGYLIQKEMNKELAEAKKIYKALDFDLNRINFVGNSRNTIENFNEIQKLNLVNSETVLITSAYHMKRSMIIAKKKNLNFYPYASDFKSARNKSLLNKYQIFSVSKNLSQFDLFFREIIGIIAFKLMHKS